MLQEGALVPTLRRADDLEPAHADLVLARAELLLARATGAGRIFTTDVSDYRIKMACALGADLALAADLNHFLRHGLDSGRSTRHPAWMAQVGRWRAQMPKPYLETGTVKPQAVIEAIANRIGSPMLGSIRHGQQAFSEAFALQF